MKLKKVVVSLMSAVAISYFSCDKLPADPDIVKQDFPVNGMPVITVQPVNDTVMEGQTATFSITATGTNLVYQWQKNGGNTPGATAATYTTPPMTMTDSGNVYKCEIKNSVGSVFSNEARLTVTQYTTTVDTSRVKTTTGGRYRVILEAPDTIAVGDTTLKFYMTVNQASDTTVWVTGLTPGVSFIHVVMGHGGNEVPYVVENGGGLYTIFDVDATMSDAWELIVILGSPPSDTVVFKIEAWGTYTEYKFSTDIEPIFQSRCTPCHITDTPRKSSLDLTTYVGVLTGGIRGRVVIPDSASVSLMIKKLKGIQDTTTEGARMPKGGPYLSSDTIAIIEKWINQGALNN